MKKLLKKALQGLSLEQQKLLQPYLNPDLTGFQNSFAFPNTFQNNTQSPSYPTSQTPIVSDNPMDNQQQDSYTAKRTFGFNPGMYGALYGANTALTGISNNVENAYQKQNIIQNRLNPLPQVGSRSNTDKYGYGFGNSFKKGGIKDLTDNVEEQKALTKLSIENGSPNIRIRKTIWNPFEWGYAGRYNTNKNRIIINNSPRMRKSGEFLKEMVSNSSYKDVKGLDNFKVNTYISELAHARDSINGTQNNNKANKELLNNFFNGHRKSVYHDPNAEEYRVHKIIEPQLRNQYLSYLGNSFKEGGDLGNYFDRYFDKAYTTKIVDAEDKSQQGLDVTDSPRLTTDMVEQGGYDMKNDYLGLFSDPSSPFRPKRQNVMNSSSQTNTQQSYNAQPDNRDWASKFRQVEDPQGKFNHGNGAYGSFGYRKSGHLQTAFKSAPEFADLRQNYKNFNNFWSDFKDDNYGQLSQVVDGKYENWLKKQSNGDLNVAGNFNLTGSKHPAKDWMVGNNMTTSAYNQRLTKQGDGGIIKDPFNLSKKVSLNNKSKSTSSTSVQTESNNDIHYIDTATLANLKTANVKFNFI